MGFIKPDLNDKEKRALILIISVSFLIKIFLAFFLQAPIRSDSYDYLNIAGNILKGEYSIYGKPTAYVGCGYPLFLSFVIYVFGEGQFYIRVVQSVLETGTGYLFFLVSRYFFNVKYSLISLALFSFLPSNIIFSQAVLSESLFGFFSMCLLYLLLRDDYKNRSSLIFLSGIISGYAVLIRTAFLPALILVPLYFFYKRKDLSCNDIISGALKCSAVFAAGALIMLAPWSIRNKLAVDTFSLGTTAGLNFWAGSNPDATGTYYNKMTENLPYDFRNESERDREYFKLGLDYAKQNPIKYFILGIKKTGYLFSSERMAVLYFTDAKPGETSTQVYRSVNPLILILVNVPYFMIILSGTWGLLALKKKRFFVYGFILTWMFTVFTFVALARYHYVLIPFFILGSVNFISEGKNLFGELSLLQKTIGFGFSLFLITVWAAEIYLMFK